MTTLKSCCVSLMELRDRYGRHKLRRGTKTTCVCESTARKLVSTGGRKTQTSSSTHHLGSRADPFAAAVLELVAPRLMPRVFPVVIRRGIWRRSHSFTPISPNKSSRDVKIASRVLILFWCRVLRRVWTGFGSSMRCLNLRAMVRLGLLFLD